MNKLFYPKLAWQNLRKNGKFYIPYILTIAGTSAAFYIMLALHGADDLPEMTRYVYLSTFVYIGTFVVGLFAVIFLFYTNSFLMKRRNRELGLYNILGMGKRHIAKVLAYETLFTAVLGVGSGIGCGILFQKLATLLMYRIMRFDVPYGFYINYKGIGLTFILFTGILALCLCFNLLRIHVQNPIELLHAGNFGEKEPKTKWFLTILGILALGTGYAVAVTAKNALQALALYFVAVILVIIGTYCLFTSISIAVLKLLRKNKEFYYKTKNFIGISGMLYRMKRNAVGLANICILSTMVLVMVSGTLALYLGTEDAMNTRYPADLVAKVRYDPAENGFCADDMLSRILAGTKENGRIVEHAHAYSYLAFAVDLTDEYFCTASDNQANNSAGTLCFITADDYAKLTNTEPVPLEKNEVLLCASDSSIKDTLAIHFADKDTGDLQEVVEFRISERLTDFPSISDYSVYMTDVYYIVVADDEMMRQLWEYQTNAFGGNASYMDWEALIDIDGTAQQQSDCAMAISDADAIRATGEDVGSWEVYSVNCRAENAAEFYSLNGGFFFLGMFLGLLFIMATVLIIYYKQVSEGYEDAERFRVMQSVGLSRKEIKRSVNSQILVVFFMPLLVAAVHVAFDFKLVALLLTLFALNNVKLTLFCTAGTLIVFMGIYAAVYALTAKTYYKIVS